MTPVSLTVNGTGTTASVEPRTALADFVREGLNLTGTHLGCEHGVCGACTVLVDGVPARSCITPTVACDGAEVTTIEGLDNDEIATELRAAFTREHALQCGYCTPGMLISARDLVVRLDRACEQSIRVGMSGNLCRCTGYVGIVRAIHTVIADRRARGIPAQPGAGRTALGPAGAHLSAAPAGAGEVRITKAVAATPSGPPHRAADPAGDEADFSPAAHFVQTFTVAFAPDEVFAVLGDVAAVAACLPGAALTAPPTPERIEGEMRVKIGPIAAAFRGTARISRDPATRSGRIVGGGLDARGRSSARGAIEYRVLPGPDPDSSRVEIEVGYTLSGVLAQFGRPGLVRDLAARLTADFAANLERKLSGSAPIPAATELSATRLLLQLIRARFRALFGGGGDA
ncbi:2Fe-2S iron-sulfur cluster-binding protein [Xanthobacter sp. KR7-65]|uniref:xanthine dehydrogenase family Fe-S subunit n=1 Tax=Xanthobacter sp. KR7-65 TaxID=3156612 RepID=UPI0032B3A091